MNRERLKKDIDAAICAAICDSLDVGDLTWGVKRELHESIWKAVETCLPETSPKTQETFTAKDARAAALQARTYEGFLRNIMEDIEFQTRAGLNVLTVTKYSNDYKAKYFSRLMQFLRAIGYEVTQTEVSEVARGLIKIRIKLSIYW